MDLKKNTDIDSVLFVVVTSPTCPACKYFAEGVIPEFGKTTKQLLEERLSSTGVTVEYLEINPQVGFHGTFSKLSTYVRAFPSFVITDTKTLSSLTSDFDNVKVYYFTKDEKGIMRKTSELESEGKLPADEKQELEKLNSISNSYLDINRIFTWADINIVKVKSKIQSTRQIVILGMPKHGLTESVGTKSSLKKLTFSYKKK